jgi:hypothetical protein
MCTLGGTLYQRGSKLNDMPFIHRFLSFLPSRRQQSRGSSQRPRLEQNEVGEGAALTKATALSIFHCSILFNTHHAVT